MKYKRGGINKIHISSKDTHCNKLVSLQLGAQVDNLQESHIVSARTLKRGSAYLSQDEVNVGTFLKFKITQKEGKGPQVIAKSREKVDADLAREDTCGEYRKTANEDHDDDSVTCSVGSCSINSYSDYNMQCKSIAFEERKRYDGDAESVCQGGYEDEIHRLELQAYWHTIEALHASGPLTWEKETMAQSWMFVHLAYESIS